MNTRLALPLAALIGATALASNPLQAQPAPIERVKISDAEQTCAQLHAETLAMDKAVVEAKEAEGQGNTTAMAGTAGSVASDVAQRTGVFGSLGGAVGQLFGQVAAKTASDVTKQSGQLTAQQATERSRQALARKEHVSVLFINKGCKASDLSYEPPPPAPGQAAAPIVVASIAATGTGAVPDKIPAPAPIVSLPELDPDGFFKGANGGTFGKNVIEVLPGNKRVAVSGFRVAFITSNTATAQVRASYLPGRDTSGASSTLIVKLSGVDAATMQTLTDRAYADFLAQMRLAGREVLPQEELKEFLAGVDVSPSSPDKPLVREVGAQTAMIFSPTGMPLWFHNGDGPWSDKGPFDQKNLRSAATYSHKLNAIVVAPLIVVNFARMSSSGNSSGLTSSAAETGATLAMHVSMGSFSSRVIRSEETRDGLVMKGDDAATRSTAGFASTLPVGTIKDVAETDNKGTKGVFDALGNAMGMANAGGAARSKKESVAETNNAIYYAAASDALLQSTGTFAKWFQKYPAK